MAKAHAMLAAFDPVTNVVLTSATVNVYNPGTVTPISATIYDKNGNVLSNPLTSDATTGLIDFYLSVAQEVDLVISKASFTTRTYSNVPVFDDASNDLSALLTTTGDTLYASGNNTPARLAINGTGGSVYAVGSGVPAWMSNVQATVSGLFISSGTVGITSAETADIGLNVQPLTTTQTTQRGIFVQPTVSSAATTEAAGVTAGVTTAASGFTVATAVNFHAVGFVKGSGSAITRAYGLLVDAISSAGTTANYGIVVNVPSGATTNIGIVNRHDYLNDNGASNISTSMTVGFVYIPTAAGTPTGVPTNAGSNGSPLYYDTTHTKLWVYDSVAGAWKGVVVS